VRESGFDIQRVIELIADRKIEEAMQEGKFDDLPGKGKPLPLDEEWFAPPELRPAIRLLKSAGVLPDWMERAREIERLRAECERLWRIAELEYPRAASARRGAVCGVAGMRTWAGLEQVMTRINALVLAYNCTAPASAMPQTPYNLAQQQARFLERFGGEGRE
jgi:hypothetical protein